MKNVTTVDEFVSEFNRIILIHQEEELGVLINHALDHMMNDMKEAGNVTRIYTICIELVPVILDKRINTDNFMSFMSNMEFETQEFYTALFDLLNNTWTESAYLGPYMPRLRLEMIEYLLGKEPRVNSEWIADTSLQSLNDYPWIAFRIAYFYDPEIGLEKISELLDDELFVSKVLVAAYNMFRKDFTQEQMPPYLDRWIDGLQPSNANMLRNNFWGHFEGRPFGNN